MALTLPVFANSFESWANGATIAAATGGISGLAINFGTASGFGFDVVTIGSGAGMTADSTYAHSGTVSCKITTTTGASCFNGWSTTMGTLTTVWFRAYLYMTANPSAQHEVFAVIEQAGGSPCASFVVTTAGKLIGRDTSNSTIFTTTNSVPLNAWFRIEGYVTGNATTGQVELKLYDTPDSVTPTETQTSSALQNTLGALGKYYFGLNTSAVNATMWMDDPALSSTGYVGPGAVVQLLTVGAPTPAGFTVNSKPTGGTSCRLKVATDQALTQNVTYAGAQTPDAYGYVSHVVTGLTPATQYYCQIADTPPGGTEMLCGPQTGQIKTLPPAKGPQGFRTALVSCTNNANETPSPNAGVSDWITWNADQNVYTGDFSYSDPVATNVPDQLAVLEVQNLFWGSAAQVATCWGWSLRSDHDSGLNNCDTGPVGSCPQVPYNVAAWQEVFPATTLGDTTYSPVHGLYQTWVIGRVRFIMIDIRTVDRSPSANTDNSSKTMLGAAQLNWFYQQLVQPEPLKVVVGDTAWMGTLDATELDKWWAYDTERQAIIAFIAANQAAVQNIMWWHGDSHCLGTATAADNTWGGFPVYCAAPLRQTGVAAPNAAATFTQMYNNSAGECRQYGRITISDTGAHVTSAFVGWDALNQVAQIAQTDVFPCPSVAARPGVLCAGL